METSQKIQKICMRKVEFGFVFYFQLLPEISNESRFWIFDTFGSISDIVLPRKLQSFPSKGVQHSLTNRLELWDRVTHQQSQNLSKT